MKQKWNYRDIIDLEHFLHQDTDTPGETLQARDRHIFLAKIAPQLAGEPQHDQLQVLRLWLQERRDAECSAANPPSPGCIAEEARKVLRLMFGLFGTLFGVAAGLTFFNYTGTTPVNVLHFLLLFVLSQLLLLVLLAVTAGVRKLRRTPAALPLSVRLAAHLSLRLVLFLHQQLINRMTAARRQTLMATIGRLRAIRATYPSLFFWPLFLFSQLFGICFNLGLLTATFLKITVSDIAFGWQSTIQFSNQALFGLVQTIALPWSWLAPEGIAYPNLAGIDGSHIVLKDGMYHLATQDLVSWWPFLLLCVLVYGLFPRLLLLGYSWYRQAKAFRLLSFDRPVHLQLLRRMQTPLVTTQARPVPAPPAKNEIAPEGATATAAVKAEQTPPPVPLVTLVPDEIFNLIALEDLETIVLDEGFTITDRLRFLVQYDADQELLQSMGRRGWDESSCVLILMEAWMPPIVSFISFLQELRRQIGRERPIYIRLVGKPAPTTPLTPVADATMENVWRQKLSSLADPYLDVAPLIRREQQ